MSMDGRSSSEIFLGQLEKKLGGIVGRVASSLERRRMPPDHILRDWSSRLRAAADAIDSYLAGRVR